MNVLNERTLYEPTLTYILGSRCRDGVVIVSDRKVTLDFGDDFDYRDKLYGVLGHVVFGSSGSTDTYEFFRGYIMDYVRTHKKNNEPITYDNLITKVSEITYTINKRHKFQYEYNFCLLVGVWYEEKPSSLHLISAYGWPRTIEKNFAIGSGEKYVRVIIKKLWNENMSMEQVAELGYFAIKYIEDFGLTQTVGVADKHPQIHYIPDHRQDYPAKEEQLEQFRSNAVMRLKDHQDHLQTLFR